MEPYLMKVHNNFPQNPLQITTYNILEICILILPETSQQSMVQEFVHVNKIFNPIHCVLGIDVTN
jgi:hypothetical protein